MKPIISLLWFRELPNYTRRQEQKPECSKDIGVYIPILLMLIYLTGALVFLTASFIFISNQCPNRWKGSMYKIICNFIKFSKSNCHIFLRMSYANLMICCYHWHKQQIFILLLEKTHPHGPNYTPTVVFPAQGYNLSPAQQSIDKITVTQWCRVLYILYSIMYYISAVLVEYIPRLVITILLCMC